MFVYQNMGIARLDIKGCSITPYPYDPGTSKFDMTFEVNEVDDGFEINTEFSTGLYREATIVNFMKHYGELLTHVCEDPGRTLGEAAIIGSSEKHRILEVFNNI